MTVLIKAAEALGMAIPDEDQQADDITNEMIIVEPHEIVSVTNPELPELTDIDRKIVEGVKELDEMILRGISAFKIAYDEIGQTEPKYRGRMIEVVSTLYGQVTGAIVSKTELQLKRAKLRTDQQAFGAKKTGGAVSGVAGSKTNNIFVGDIDSLKKMFEGKQEPAPAK